MGEPAAAQLHLDQVLAQLKKANNRSRQVEARLSGRPTGRPHATGEAMNAFPVQSIRDTVILTHALGQ
jgi:hypothetical protein